MEGHIKLHIMRGRFPIGKLYKTMLNFFQKKKKTPLLKHLSHNSSFIDSSSVTTLYWEYWDQGENTPWICLSITGHQAHTFTPIENFA